MAAVFRLILSSFVSSICEDGFLIERGQANNLIELRNLKLKEQFFRVNVGDLSISLANVSFPFMTISLPRSLQDITHRQSNEEFTNGPTQEQESTSLDQELPQLPALVSDFFSPGHPFLQIPTIKIEIMIPSMNSNIEGYTDVVGRLIAVVHKFLSLWKADREWRKSSIDRDWQHVIECFCVKLQDTLQANEPQTERIDIMDTIIAEVFMKLMSNIVSRLKKAFESTPAALRPLVLGCLENLAISIETINLQCNLVPIEISERYGSQDHQFAKEEESKDGDRICTATLETHEQAFTISINQVYILPLRAPQAIIEEMLVHSATNKTDGRNENVREEFEEDKEDSSIMSKLVQCGGITIDNNAGIFIKIPQCVTWILIRGLDQWIRAHVDRIIVKSHTTIFNPGSVIINVSLESLIKYATLIVEQRECEQDASLYNELVQKIWDSINSNSEDTWLSKLRKKESNRFMFVSDGDMVELVRLECRLPSNIVRSAINGALQQNTTTIIITQSQNTEQRTLEDIQEVKMESIHNDAFDTPRDATVAFEIPISRASLVKWENLEECISLFGDNDKVELLLHGNDLPIELEPLLGYHVQITSIDGYSQDSIFLNDAKSTKANICSLLRNGTEPTCWIAIKIPLFLTIPVLLAPGLTPRSINDHNHVHQVKFEQDISQDRVSTLHMTSFLKASHVSLRLSLANTDNELEAKSVEGSNSFAILVDFYDIELNIQLNAPLIHILFTVAHFRAVLIALLPSHEMGVQESFIASDQEFSEMLRNDDQPKLILASTKSGRHNSPTLTAQCALSVNPNCSSTTQDTILNRFSSSILISQLLIYLEHPQSFVSISHLCDSIDRLISNWQCSNLTVDVMFNVSAQEAFVILPERLILESQVVESQIIKECSRVSLDYHTTLPKVSSNGIILSAKAEKFCVYRTIDDIQKNYDNGFPVSLLAQERRTLFTTASVESKESESSMHLTIRFPVGKNKGSAGSDKLSSSVVLRDVIFVVDETIEILFEILTNLQANLEWRKEIRERVLFYLQKVEEETLYSLPFLKRVIPWIGSFSSTSLAIELDRVAVQFSQRIRLESLIQPDPYVTHSALITGVISCHIGRISHCSASYSQFPQILQALKKIFPEMGVCFPIPTVDILGFHQYSSNEETVETKETQGYGNQLQSLNPTENFTVRLTFRVSHISLWLDNTRGTQFTDPTLLNSSDIVLDIHDHDSTIGGSNYSVPVDKYLNGIPAVTLGMICEFDLTTGAFHPKWSAGTATWKDENLELRSQASHNHPHKNFPPPQQTKLPHDTRNASWIPFSLQNLYKILRILTNITLFVTASPESQEPRCLNNTILDSLLSKFQLILDRAGLSHINIFTFAEPRCSTQAASIQSTRSELIRSSTTSSWQDLESTNENAHLTKHLSLLESAIGTVLCELCPEISCFPLALRPIGRRMGFLHLCDLNSRDGFVIDDKYLDDILSSRSKELMSIHLYACHRIVAPRVSLGFTQLKRISLSYLPNFADDGLVALLHAAIELTQLELKMCPEIRNPCLNDLTMNRMRYLSIEKCDHLTDSGIVSLTQAMPLLEFVRISECGIKNALLSLPQSNTVDVSGCTALSDNALSYLLQHGTNITSLNICDCGSILSPVIASPQLSELFADRCVRLKHQTLRQLGNLCPSLKTLHLRGCHGIGSDVLKDIPTPAMDWVRGVWQRIYGPPPIEPDIGVHTLLELSLAKCWSLEDIHLEYILSHCPNLHLLDLTECKKLQSPRFGNKSASSSLRALSLKNCIVTQNCIKGAIRSCTSLESLDISGCNHVQHVGFDHISQSIQKVKMSGCISLEEKDIQALISLGAEKSLASLDISYCTQLKRIFLPSTAEANTNQNRQPMIQAVTPSKVVPISNVQEFVESCTISQKRLFIYISGCSSLLQIHSDNHDSGWILQSILHNLRQTGQVSEKPVAIIVDW